MTEYRCFFFGPEDRPSDGERVYDATEIFQARSDDEARIRAHGLCRRNNHVHGFEVWSGDTLVHRHAPSSVLRFAGQIDCACFPMALDEAEERDLKAILSHRNIERHRLLFTEGDAAEYLYGVISGGLKVFKSLRDGRTLMTGFLLPGEALSLPIRGSYPYSAEAFAATTLCQYPTASLQAVLERHPRLSSQFREITYNQLAAANDHMVMLGRKTITERVCSFLADLLQRIERVSGPVEVLPIPLLRSEIAEYLGVTIETVSRIFSRLRKDRLISFERSDQIVIEDRLALMAIADGNNKSD